MYILIYFILKYLGKKDQPIDIHRRAVVHMNCLSLQYLHISTVLASTTLLTYITGENILYSMIVLSLLTYLTGENILCSLIVLYSLTYKTS
jgi:hypothetical protein